MASLGASQKSPARTTRIISTLLCLLAFAIALLPCTTAMAAMPTPTAAPNPMTMAPAAMHCAECCPTQLDKSITAPCCAAPTESTQQISLTAFDLPHPTASAALLPQADAAINHTALATPATLRTRSPLHPILRI